MMGENGGVSSMPPLEVGIALRCNHFIIMMADTRVNTYLLTDGTEVDKIAPMENSTLLMSLGGAGQLFSRIIHTSMNLHTLRTTKPYPMHLTVRLIGHTIQDIRSNSLNGEPLDLHVMLGITDSIDGPRLYKGDPFGFLLEVPYAYIGINGFLTVSIVDKYYRPDLTLQEAYSVLQHCVQHMKRRTIISCPKFTVKVLDRSGHISQLPDFKWADIEI